MGKVEEVIKEATGEVHSILGSGYQEGDSLDCNIKKHRGEIT